MSYGPFLTGLYTLFSVYRSCFLSISPALHVISQHDTVRPYIHTCLRGRLSDNASYIYVRGQRTVPHGSESLQLLTGAPFTDICYVSAWRQYDCGQVGGLDNDKECPDRGTDLCCTTQQLSLCFSPSLAQFLLR